MRPQAAVHHLAGADLVEDLAGLLVGVPVDLLALVLGQVAQHAARELRVEVQQEDRADQRVAAERDREPG